MTSLLSVTDLEVCFHREKDVYPVLEELSFSLDAGERFALVGESGCGKSMTSLALMNLLPGGFRVSSGSVLFEGRELTGLGEEEMRRIRGCRMSMIFQDPLTALNPLLPVGYQIAETLLVHEKITEKEALEKALHLMNLVEIPGASSRLREYPHQFSGGQRQRMMIAMAIACEPALLIADEPTTALDVTVQASVMKLILQLCSRSNMALVFISHNLALVKNYCRKVGVMYGGVIQEWGPSGTLFSRPLHPYTRGLMACLPSMHTPKGELLAPIAGHPPALSERPAGCIFHPRCAEVRRGLCDRVRPRALHCGGDHYVRCHIYGE